MILKNVFYKICEFLALGNTHRQIAKRVNVSPTTVGVIAKKLDEIEIPVAEVLKKDPGYYSWMLGADFPNNTKQILTRIRLREFNNR